MQDIEAALKAMPIVDVEARGYVEDSDTITASDAVTIEITVTYKMLEED